MADWFVDFSASNDGDGTAFGQAASPAGVGAYNTLASKTFTSGDKVWIRRKTLTITSLLTLNQAGTIYIGWPQSGDTYFSTRPVAAQATWDADAVGYAEVTATTNFAIMVTVATNTGQMFYRMKFNCAYTSTLAMDAMVVAAQSEFYTCFFQHQGTSASAVQRALLASASSKYKDCTITFTGAANTTNVQALSMQTASTICQFIGCTISLGSGVTNAQVINSATSSDVHYIDCSITSANVGVTGNMVTIGSATTYMYNCTIDSESTGAQAQFISTAGARFHAVRLTVNKGRLFTFPIASVVHFARFNQTVNSSTFAIVTNSGSRITGANFTFAPANTSGDIGMSVGTTFNLKNCVFSSQTPLGVVPSTVTRNFPGVWLSDYNGVVGAFRFIGPNGEVNTNNVFRTGGEAFSLKLDMNNGVAGTDPFWRHLLFTLPGQETMHAYVPASSSTVTVFGAYKGYGSSPPTTEDLWLDVDHWDLTTNAHRAYSSTRGTSALTSDNSTWTGDGSLTSFKMAIAMTPGQASLVPIRIFLTKRTPGAYIYIDPKPVVS